MRFFKDIQESILHLAFPHICAGCGNDVLEKENSLCLHCLSLLPDTGFHLHDHNPVEKIFTGRLPVTFATAQYYFTKQSLMQRLMHAFKYRGDRELGIFLGELMGRHFLQSGKFSGIEALVPLPLFPVKERKRGYNQADLLCKGIASVLNLPVLNNVVIRTQPTESQTKKNRVERWQNIEGRFELINESLLYNKHILLVDDVITTGATLEACGSELLKAAHVQLSIAALCFSSG